MPTTSLSGVEIQEVKPWLEPKVLATIHRENANDARCVSWILRNITDPEAFDAAIRLAGTIRWFDEPDVDVPYDSIVSTFEACFDPSEELYPGSTDKAYYSARAMLWIHSLARFKSEEFASRFPLSRTHREGPWLDHDLVHLFNTSEADWSDQERIEWLLVIHPYNTPSHMQWVSDALLCLSRVTRPEKHHEVTDKVADEVEIVVPLNVTLNRLLMWCSFLGLPPAEEALMIQNKSCDICSFAFKNTHSTLL